MGLFKSIWHFSGPEGAGWEEVYSDGSATATDAGVFTGSNVVKTRLEMAHPTVTLNSVSVRDLNNRNLPPVVYSINLSGTGLPVNQGPANTDEAAVIRLGCKNTAGTIRASRFVWVRGLVENALERAEISGAMKVSAEFGTAASRWYAALATANYGTNPRLRATWEGPLFRRAIDTITGSPAQDTTVIKTKVPHGLGANSLIQINDTSKKVLPGLRGLFTVVAFTADTVTVRYRCAQVDPPASGYLYHYEAASFCVVDPATCGIFKLGSRQTKKSVGGSRGRRSATRLRK